VILLDHGYVCDPKLGQSPGRAEAAGPTADDNHRWTGHRMNAPPLMSYVAPLMNPASSEVSIAISQATSPAPAERRTGISSSICRLRISGGITLAIAVSIRPG